MRKGVIGAVVVAALVVSGVILYVSHDAPVSGEERRQAEGLARRLADLRPVTEADTTRWSADERAVWLGPTWQGRPARTPRGYASNRSITKGIGLLLPVVYYRADGSDVSLSEPPAIVEGERVSERWGAYVRVSSSTAVLFTDPANPRRQTTLLSADSPSRLERALRDVRRVGGSS